MRATIQCYPAAAIARQLGVSIEVVGRVIRRECLEAAIIMHGRPAYTEADIERIAEALGRPRPASGGMPVKV